MTGSVPNCRYELACAAANEGLWDWDLRAGAVHRSPRLQEILGHAPESVTASPTDWLDLIHADDKDHYSQSFRAFLRGQVTRFQCQYRIRHAYGGYIWVLDRAKELRDESDRVYRVAGSLYEISDQVRAQQALKRSEQQFRGVVETASGMLLWDTDPHHRFTYMSGRGRNRDRVPDEDIIGKTAWEFAGADPDTEEKWAWRKARMESHLPFGDFRYSVAMPDGEERWYRVAGVPTFGEDGRFSGYRGITTNETEIVTAMKRAQQAEELLRDAVESISEGFVIYDAGDRLVMCNDKYTKLVSRRSDILKAGVSFEDLLRDGVKMGLYPQARGQEEQWIQEHLSAHRNPGGSIEVQLNNGRWFLVTDRRMKSGGVAGLRIDITKQKAIQEKLSQSEGLLHIAGELAHLGGWVLKLPGRQFVCSKEVTAILEVRPKTPISLEEGIEFFAPEGRESIMDAFETCIRDGVPFDREFEMIPISGRRIWVRTIGRAVRDPSGVISRIEGAFQDVTESKKARDNIRQLEIQLEKAEHLEAIGQLTGGVAHDFNNLLGVIIGNLDILREMRKSDSDVIELSGEALDAALRGSDLTRQLLAYARRQPLQPKRVDVNECVTAAVQLLKRTIGENIEIQVETASSELSVLADPAQLETSILNLATNARDAMPNGGQLIITTGGRYLDVDYASQHIEVTPGDYVMIEVRDTGIGMSPEVQSRIFEPFFTTKARDKGTGLGLSMVFGYIKQSSGHISVYSEFGLGTTFRLYLPRIHGGIIGCQVRKDAEKPIEGRGETILAVEDNPGLRRVVFRQLKELGYDAVEAKDATAALKILESKHVDLVFTDVVMPGQIGGMDLARLVMERWPSTRVILTSGFSGTDLNATAASTAGIDMLSKPYRKEDLAWTLRRVLDERHQ